MALLDSRVLVALTACRLIIACELLHAHGQLCLLLTANCCNFRPAYEKVIKELDIRPLKVQAGRNVIVKIQEGVIAEPEKVHQTDAAAEQ